MAGLSTLHGRPMRALAELAGLVGAEITGVMGAAVGAAVAAIGWPPAVVVGVVLVPVLAAGAGPFGYDMAQSWVPEDERPPMAVPGSRAAAHIAGVAGALAVILAMSALAFVTRSVFAGVLSFVAVLSLPYQAAVGRGVAIRRSSHAGPLLAVSSVAGLCAALAFWLVVLSFMGRWIGDD